MYKYGETKTVFNGGLFLAVAITWLICLLSLIKAPKFLGVINCITVVCLFVFVFALVIKFVDMNDSVEGIGSQYYLGGVSIILKDGSIYDPSVNLDDIVVDAYNQVFYSISVCVGAMYAYGSYNDVKKPAILDPIVVSLLDFIFSIISGFSAWNLIGYLI